MTLPAHLIPLPTIDLDNAICLWFRDPFARDLRESYRIEPGTTVGEWLEQSGLGAELSSTPTLVVLNDSALLEENFDTILGPADVIALIPNPGVIATATIVGWVITGVLTAYSLYLSYTAKPPKQTGPERSPSNDISYRGNRARPGAPIPVVYGQMRVYFDLSRDTYTRFAADGQTILYMLMEATQGSATITDYRYEETGLADFEAGSYAVETLLPGTASTIMPLSVNVSGGS